MAFMTRKYMKSGAPEINYYGGNCGCSDCLNCSVYSDNGSVYSYDGSVYSDDDKSIEGGNKIFNSLCDCNECKNIHKYMLGGNFFDTLSNMMPDILSYVPIAGPVLKEVTKGVLEVLDPYRKNPQFQKPTKPLTPEFVAYRPIKDTYNIKQKEIIEKLNKKPSKTKGGINYKKVHFKKGSIEAKEKMAYLRSLRKS
jgi:hypothetical protein